tara:strand:+ start:87 stop:755 length:669 start_codon:yes stop_codon:yes gene_type:complete
MNKEYNQLLAAYSKVNHQEEEIVQEWNPVNAIGQAARGFVTGKSAVPGSGLIGGALKAIPGMKHVMGRQEGKWEIGAETNRLWDMFNKDVLTTVPEPRGDQVKGWFKTTANIDPGVNRVLNNLDDQKAYGSRQLHDIFRKAVEEQQRLFAMGQTGDASNAATAGITPGESKIAGVINGMTVDEKKELISKLHCELQVWSPAPAAAPAPAPAPAAAPAPAPAP